jgi:uncharacterized protein (UPF0332 family)
MSNAQIKYYLEQSEKFWKQAEDELKRGELQQASEKYWGAASLAVKALAELKGYRHDGHALLFQIIDKVSQERNDESLKLQFITAGMLHTNFYEGWLTKGEVQTGALQVKEFISKIKEIIQNEEG